MYGDPINTIHAAEPARITSHPAYDVSPSTPTACISIRQGRNAPLHRQAETWFFPPAQRCNATSETRSTEVRCLVTNIGSNISF
ncbi:hypothetical protein PGTUg99_024988 [Puccinia graminis f. sp. tritici]|uniref:Uncharacterized protein n=1 Tax=Puccinia graminis f. sp. tritici TaxID=56615 RepID=A0A5B0Q921_PUCGR|nr:hypothetical protein PGTUg99_024988 [Puccinia graminis f. sp. tritici]